MDNGVHLFDDGSDLLGDSTVGLNDFAHLLDDGFDHFVDHTVGLVLEGGVLYLRGVARGVTLLDIHSAGRRAEMDLDGHVIGVHLDDLRLLVVLLLCGQRSELNGPTGMNGRFIGGRAIALLGGVLDGRGGQTAAICGARRQVSGAYLCAAISASITSDGKECEHCEFKHIVWVLCEIGSY